MTNTNNKQSLPYIDFITFNKINYQLIVSKETINNHGWISSVLSKAEDLEEIFISGIYHPEKNFNRSLNTKVHQIHVAKKVWYIHIEHSKRGILLNEAMVLDRDTFKEIPCQFGHLHSPDWDANSKEALSILIENQKQYRHIGRLSGPNDIDIIYP